MQMIGNSWVRGFKRNNGRDEFEGQLPPTTVPTPSPSQEIIIKEILQSIHDPRVGEIGVYGIEGAGKRTIMQHVMCRAQISLSFDTFIAVSIHLNRSTELHKEIAKSLSWSVMDEDAETVARNIPSYLANKKFLLHVHVLICQTDDPFRFIQMAGVPYPTRQNGCKIVVSSPAFHKSGDRQFVVKGLSMEEAWELFSEKASEAVNSPHLQPYAKKLFVESQMKCKPLRINLLGGAMRNVRDLHLWAELNKRNAWEFCYDQIPTDEIKNCFSYCSMFPLGHAFYIHELIECWIMEGLIDGEDAYKNGLVVLKQLLDRCLLHRVLNDRVTMHATVLEWRNGYPNDKRFTMLSDHMPDWESIENLTVVMAEKILQCSPQCPNLSTLLLIRGSNGIEEIPSSFFEHMPVLRVLKIYETPIRSLPPSLSNLRNLRSLVLRGCPFFRTLPDIRASTLNKLEQLDLSRTAMEALPPWISALTNLQRIILRGCEFFKTLPDLRALEKLEVLDISGTAIKSLPPSISDLCNLQKLLARDCPLLTMVPNLQPLQKLEVLDLLNTPIKEFPEGVFKLVHLRLLQLDQCRFELLEPSGSSLGANMYASDARYIRMFFEDRESAKWLPRFHFNVYPCGGRDALDDIHFQSIQFHYNHVYLKVKYPATCNNYDKSLEVSGSTSSKDDIIAVLDHIELLTLRDYKLLTDLSEMGFENTKGLKDCRLERCHEMESVVSKKGEDGKMLESLQNLWISNLSSFMSMCAGKVQPGSFACLKQIYLDCCPNLESVFSSPLTIEKLELIDIRYCDKLEKIFAEEIDVECSFPGLKSLLLWELPELKCVCEGILAPPLEKLTVRECPQLKKLPLGFRNVKPPLEIRGSLRWWNDLEWEDDRIKCRILFREWGWF